MLDKAIATVLITMSVLVPIFFYFVVLNQIERNEILKDALESGASITINI